MKLNLIDFGLGVLATSAAAILIPAKFLFFASLLGLAIYSMVKKAQC